MVEIKVKLPLVGSRAGLDTAVAKRKVSVAAGNRTPTVQPVAESLH
jgi:hypothetical protein